MKVKIATATALALMFAAAAWLLVYERMLRSHFDAVNESATQTDVVQILGSPNNTGMCRRFGGDPIPSCVEEFAYLSLLSFSEVWTISFDDQKRVIRKTHYKSP